MNIKRIALGFWLLVLSYIMAAGGDRQYARLGDFQLESGAFIRDCFLGYRTFGALNTARSNVILYPTWFEGTSADIARLIGPEELIDSSAYFIIAIDAFGNGVSSSPSNSKSQPDDRFPHFTIRDLVRAQYQFLTAEFGLDSIYAMIGGSMGSFQVFEWLVMYPDFMQKAIPYVGSPRLSSYDLLLMEHQLRIIENGRAAGLPAETIKRQLNLVTELGGRTPEYRVRHTPPRDYELFLEELDNKVTAPMTLADKASQIRAMMAHDIYRHFDGSAEKNAGAIRAQVFMIVSATDHMVSPLPALELARLLGCDILVLENDCGHLAIGCELARCAEAIDQFLKRNR